jgi:hypothetical protein
MRNMNPKIVEILDFPHLKFKYNVCGQAWSPTIKLGARFISKRLAMF